VKFELTESAKRDLKRLGIINQKQILKKLKFFSEQPDPLKHAVKLTNFSRGGDYRFRVGQYRVVFDVAKDTLYILYIEHRRDVYRRR
jgi:mRNA interferase RelE/StbE